MSIQSIGEYPTIMKDSVAFPLPPDMPFGALLSEIVPVTYKVEPDFEKLDFDKTEVIWEIDGKVVTPDYTKSLKENGIGHKSFIQFTTPTLTGKLGA